MLYLEDYIEMIEHLPQELRDRFTEIREIDLGIQNSKDRLENKVEEFFSNATTMQPNEKEAEYEAIRREYYKMLEDADKKVYLVNQMQELVNRYFRRLDEEINKFKVDLEAKNKGITEIIEKRSLELDQPSTSSSQKENRYSATSNRSQSHRTSQSRGAMGYFEERDGKASLKSIEKRLAVQKISVPSSRSSGSCSSVPEQRSVSANSCPRIPQATLIPSAATTWSAGTSINEKEATSTNVSNANVLMPLVQQQAHQQQQQQQESVHQQQQVAHQHQQHQQ